MKKDGWFEKKKGEVLHNYHGGNVPTIRCYHRKKEGHTRKACHDRLYKYGGKDNYNATIMQDDYESSDVLVVSSSNSRKD